MKILMLNTLKEMKIVLGLSLLFLLFMSCSGERPGGKGRKPDKGSDEKEKTETKTEQTKTKVLVQQVSYGPARISVSSFGKVEAYYKLDVVSEVGGKIMACDVILKPGASFKKGKTILSIDSEEASYAFKARVSNYLNRLAQVLPDVKVDFSSKYPEWKKHFEAIGMDKDLPALPDISTPQENTFFASQGILSDYYSLKSEEARLKKYMVKAPFNGRIVDVLLEKGMVANMGSRVMSILSDDEKEVSFPLTISDVEYVRIGQRVEITNERTDKTWRGQVVRIGAQVKSNTQSVDVYVRIEAGQQLKDGSYVNGLIRASQITDVFALPSMALLSDKRVFCVENGQLVKKSIELMHSDGKTIWIRGLKPNAFVVVESLVNAVEGMEVVINYSAAG